MSNLLVVDVGNTNIVLGIYRGDELATSWRLATMRERTADAKYVGGVIAPGLNISAEALFARAARLPRVDIRRPPSVIGTNTVVNMQSGLYFGYLGLVDGILTRIKNEVPDVKRVIATGGLAALFEEDSEHIDETDSELTLKGLKIIYDRNRGGRRR